VYFFVRFVVLTIMMPFSFIGGYQHLGGTYYLHLFTTYGGKPEDHNPVFHHLEILGSNNILWLV
jgi:hypothetical protein